MQLHKLPLNIEVKQGKLAVDNSKEMYKTDRYVFVLQPLTSAYIFIISQIYQVFLFFFLFILFCWKCLKESNKTLIINQ